jgi:hypothetical protein
VRLCSAARAIAGSLLWAVACPWQAAAQRYQAQPARYLLTTNVSDARALWVNPAGLMRGLEASLGGDATLDRTGGALRLAQFGLSVQSRNFAFGWSHNRYPGGIAANDYALALALGDEALSVGATRHWFRGGLNSGSWDAAVRARVTPTLDVSLVWRDIGSPVVRDTILHQWPTSIIPAAGILLFGGRLHTSMEAQVEADLSDVREVRAGAVLALGFGLSLSLRGDFSPTLDHRRGFAAALTWSRAAGRSALVTLLPADAGSLDAIGAAGLIVATPQRRLR